MGILEDPSRTLGEAQVALHPSDPATFAIAVSDGRRPDAFASDVPSLEPRGLAVYVTQDGGTTFRRTSLDLNAVGDLPYNPAAMGADPAVVFAPDGSLHVAGLVVDGYAGSVSNPVSVGTTLFVTRSADLGASWTEPVVLASGGSNDREWIAASPSGEVVVTWRDHTRGVSVFARVDGGAPDPVDLPGCLQVSNAVWHAGVPVVACQEEGGLRVLELADPPVPRGLAPGACPSNSARLAGHGDILVATCYYGSAAISGDGGWTFTHELDVFEKTSLDDGWDGGIGPNVFAVGMDARGAAHLVLSRFPSSGDQQPTGDGRPVAHVVLDAERAEVLHEREVQSEASGEGPAGYGFADDFWNMEFRGERGILVWTASDWSVRFAVMDLSS